ncbi:MAG: phage tail protein, partial [Hyphomicrobiales bacterium]|nr:phage tail protein [Hyphomicrobiales bacterium]
MADYIGVVTNAGAQKIAAAIGGAALNLSVIRVGDGNGAPIVPAPAMTDLVRRVGVDYPIIAAGRDPVNANMWRVTALIPVGDGPFDIREIAVFDADGTMIAIANHVLVEKRTPAQGAAVEITTDIVFPVSSTAQVTVQVLPSASVAINQMLRAGFQSIESAALAAAPGNPVVGA